MFYNHIAEKNGRNENATQSFDKNECVFNISAKIQMCLEKDMNCFRRSTATTEGLNNIQRFGEKRKQHTNVAITLCTKKGSCYGSLTLFSHCDEMKDWPKQAAKHAYDDTYKMTTAVAEHIPSNSQQKQSLTGICLGYIPAIGPKAKDAFLISPWDLLLSSLLNSNYRLV